MTTLIAKVYREKGKGNAKSKCRHGLTLRGGGGIYETSEKKGNFIIFIEDMMVTCADGLEYVQALHAELCGGLGVLALGPGIAAARQGTEPS